MPDKVPPAILARTPGFGRYGVAAPTGSTGSWLDYFRIPSIKFPAVIPWHSFPTEKKHILIAISVTTAISMGGFLAWYIYASTQQQQSKRGDQQLRKNGKKLGIDAIDTSGRLARKKTNSVPISEGPNPDALKGVLILHQCPRGRRTPCIAPYPLKLETFLRIHGIKYEVQHFDFFEHLLSYVCFNNVEPRQSDAPLITLDLEDICDSQNCMKFLVQRYGINLETGLSESDKSTVRAYNHLLENHLYWGIALWRWVYDGARSLNEIQVLPQKTLLMIPQVCKTVEQAAWFHGIGKKTPNDVTEAVVQDLAALANLLGLKSFFLGENPCELDCTAFAMLAQMLWNMDGSPYEKAIKDNHTNLVEFCWRMRTTYWPDWENCLSNDNQVAGDFPIPLHADDGEDLL